jgi:hypothetical protein
MEKNSAKPEGQTGRKKFAENTQIPSRLEKVQ